MKKKGKGKKPDEFQRQLILKSGYDPFEWNVVYEKKDCICIYNRFTEEYEEITK